MSTQSADGPRPAGRLLPGGPGVRFATALARRPHRMAHRATILAGDLAHVGLGRSTLAAAPADRRFTNPARSANPLLRRLVQAYLAAGRTAEGLVADADLVQALAPSNQPLTSPVFELLQYRPRTPRVRRVPLLVVPPTINRYHILDLAPGRSLVEYLAATGQRDRVAGFALAVAVLDQARAGTGTVDTDAYLVAGAADHLCPWQACYRSTQLLGGHTRFVLSSGGHIAAMVNPPGTRKASFRTGPDNPPDPADWLDR